MEGEQMINGGNEFNYYWIMLLMFKDVLLGLLGGLIAYLFDYKRAGKEGKEAVFKVSGVVINMALGAFVGYVIGTLLPPDTTARDALIALSGVTSYNILLLAESRFATWVFEKIVGKDASNKRNDNEMDNTVQR